MNLSTEAKSREAIAAVIKTVDVARTPADAFRVFTKEMDSWWPLATHSVAQQDARRCTMECRPGGEIFELTEAGDRHLWGTIEAWEPPDRLAFTWHPGRGAETAGKVELTFAEIADGTRVTLEHRGWENLGAEAGRLREGYDSGWELVLGKAYRSRCQKASSQGESGELGP